MKRVARRLTFGNLFRSIICILKVNVIIFRNFMFGPITSMPTNRLTFFSPVMVTKGRKFMFVARPFRNFRLTNTMCFTILVLACVWECSSSKITNGRRVIFLLVVGNRNRSTIRIFRRIGAFIAMGNGSSFTITSNLRVVFSNMLYAGVPVIMSFSIRNGSLFPIKAM